MRANEFDARISKALQHGVVVSAFQKQRVWERIERRAGHQMMLPPLEVVERQSRLRRLTLKVQAFYQHMHHLAVDEACYIRAYNSGCVLRYGGVSSESRPVPHVFELLRYSLMSPAF